MIAQCAGAKTYTAQQFLDALHPPDEPAAPRQTVAQMETHLMAWCTDANAIRRESGTR